MSTPVMTEAEILQYIKDSYERGMEKKDSMFELWKQMWADKNPDIVNMHELIGYRPPDFLITIAYIAAFLYEQTGGKQYAETVHSILPGFGDHRQHFPKRFAGRTDYSGGVPAVNWFRTLPMYVTAYQKTVKSGLYSEKDKAKIAESVASGVNIIFFFPEWGAHNRAMLRAESLLCAAKTFPKNKDAAKWRKMAEILASDSLGKWEIEDAQIYHPVWLRAYVNYLDTAENTRAFQSPTMKFYFDYYVGLLMPNGAIAEFGDGRWDELLNEYYLLLERGAKEYQCGEMKWTAQKIFKRIYDRAQKPFRDDKAHNYTFVTPEDEFAVLLIDRNKYVDPAIEPEKPPYLSGDCLEEIISKKIVLRSGWDKNDTYVLYNYKDEGYYSVMQKDYLKNVLAVEEEKAHHGHSDEQSICMFMKEGCVLLSDAGYRINAPSDEYGGFRADIFHNRLCVRNVKKSLNQPYFDVLRNSGAHNTNVRTTRIDFQDFNAVEYLRTRLEDQRMGYRWDRTVTRNKAEDYLIAADTVNFMKSGYFTLANLWHTRQILDKGDGWFLTRIDLLRGAYENGDAYNLLVVFPQKKPTGTETEMRDFQEETALYQGASQYYDAGKIETFVTYLIPLKKGADPLQAVKRFRLIKDDAEGMLVSVDGKETRSYGIKCDLDRDLIKEEYRPRYTWESGRITYGDAQTDADFFCLSETEGNPYFAGTNLVRFDYNGKTLFDTPEGNFFQVWGKSDHSGKAKWRRWDNQ